MHKRLIIISLIVLCMVITLIPSSSIFVYKTEKMTDRQFDNTKEQFELGRSYMQQEKYLEAIKKLSKVRQDDPDYVRALGALGTIYYRMEDYKNASIHWNALVKIDPDNKMIKAMLKNINENSKDRIHYDHSAPEEGSPAWMKDYLEAERHIKEKKFSSARDILEKLIKSDHTDFKIYFALGAVYKELGDWDKIILNWTEALALSPSDPVINKLLPHIKRIRKIEKDIENIKEQINNGINHWKSHLNLAKKFAELYALSPHERGMTAKASVIDELKQVLKLNPSHLESYITLIKRLEQSEKYDDAVYYAKKVVELEPEVEAYKRLLQKVSELRRIKELSLQHIALDTEAFIEGAMILIPEGEFIMGTDDDSIGVRNNERPERKLFLKDYYIDQYEVSNIYFRNFVEDTRYNISLDIRNRIFQTEYNYYPVVNVTWFDAESYCRWIGKRLPTEEEWEKAARGIDKRKYPWGDVMTKEYANTRLSGFMKLTPVGGYKDGVSPYGVYDMAGNAQEWTDSWYKSYSGDLPDKKKLFKVLRGGSFILDPLYSTTTSRDYKAPAYRSASAGFRCAGNG